MSDIYVAFSDDSLCIIRGSPKELKIFLLFYPDGTIVDNNSSSSSSILTNCKAAGIPFMDLEGDTIRTMTLLPASDTHYFYNNSNNNSNRIFGL